MKADTIIIAILAATVSFFAIEAQACDMQDLIGNMPLVPGDADFKPGTPIEAADLPEFLLNRIDMDKFDFVQRFSGLVK